MKLSNNLNNTDFVASFKGHIVHFSNTDDLYYYMNDEGLKMADTVLSNYWGIFVLNDNVTLKNIQKWSNNNERN